MSEPVDVLKLVATRLDSCGIPYMLSGSTALNYYALPRMTRDIDVVVELDAASTRALVEAFTGDFYVDADAVARAVRERGIFNLIHLDYMLKVDFIVRKEGPYRRAEFARRLRVTIDEVEVMIVAPEDLLLSKLHWAKDSRSEMQLGDARSLVECVPKLDWAYLDHWAIDLGVGELLAEVRT